MFDLKSPLAVVSPRWTSRPELSHPPAVPPSGVTPGRIARQTRDYASPARWSVHVPHAAVESTQTPHPPSSHPNPPSAHLPAESSDRSPAPAPGSPAAAPRRSTRPSDAMPDPQAPPRPARTAPSPAPPLVSP